MVVPIQQRSEFLQRIIDAFPALTLVVTHDVSVVAFNTAASRALDLDERALKQLTGNVLSCVNAWEGGCGRTRKCRDCDVRLSVARAQEGEATAQKHTKMRLRVGQKYGDFYLVVSASPFDYEGNRQVLLVIENVTELVQVRQLLPICSRCGAIRGDEDYREKVGAYQQAHADAIFPMARCPAHEDE